MSELIDIIISAVDEASSTFESIVGSAEDAQSSLEGMGDSAESIPTDAIEDTANAVDDVEQEANESATALENINNIISGMVGAEVFGTMADTLMDLADKAGTYQDSMMRASLEAEGAGISVNDMTDAISQLSSETGRAGGEIRESFIKATARGITDIDSFKSMMEGAGAQATLFGTDIQTMGDKFSGLAFNTNLMPKALKETGITMDELGTAMGMTGATADEVKEKWKELDANQRAAALGMAASMNEGEDANEAYKNSWAGVQAQIDIAKGRIERLVGSVLLPVLIPAMRAAANVLNWLGDIVQGVMDGPLGGLVSAIGAVAAGIALAVPAIAAIQAGMALFTASIWPAVTASWALIAPWLPFIAIGAAVVLVIYEIGKAFGWWKDASSMIDAISAGLQEMWNAFINHPDVQAAIQYLSDGFQWLQQAIGGVISAIGEFFGISAGDKFDILHTLINGIGEAWDSIREPVMAYIDILTTIFGVMAEVLSGNMTLTEGIQEYWNSLVANLPIILGALFNLFVTIWSSIGTAVLNACMNIINGVINWFSQLPGLAFNYLNETRLRILAQLNAWVTLAKLKASQLVNGVLTWLRQLPGKVYSALLQVVSRIVSAGSQWASSARTQANNVVNAARNGLSGITGAISSALSGVVSAITSPFQEAYNQVSNIASNIKQKVEDALNDAKSLIDARGGEEADGRQSLLIGAEKTPTITSSNQEDHLTVDINQNINLDLSNVPGHIDTNTLIQMLSDKKVLSALTSNNDFQSLDAKVKERLNLRVNRARGV